MAQPGTFDDFLIRISKRLTSVERRLGGGGTSGSAEMRDAVYGIPANNTERAELGNRRPVWFNSDDGWYESYYAMSGLPGLTAPALLSGTPSGWYPIGPGPFIVAEPVAPFAATAGNYVGGWSTGVIRRRGGENWFTITDLVQIKRAGVYDLRAWTNQQQGTGTGNYHMRVMNAAGSTVMREGHGNAFPLQSAFVTRAHMEMELVNVSAGWQFGIWVQSGALTVHSFAAFPRAQISVRYVGPLLETQ